MKSFSSHFGDLIWRSDTRHSEALLSWLMLGASFTQVFRYAEQPILGYLVYAVVMLFVAIIGFGASVHGSYLARIQCAMLRTFCWPAVGIHAFMTQHLPAYLLPAFIAVTLGEALIYIKLYLLISQRREKNSE